MNQQVQIVDFADRNTLVEKLTPQLPPNIKAERFVAVIMTAMRSSPVLGKCDRASLWTACEQAAQDGLLPDGREGAIVPYKSKRDGRDIWIAQWLPMIAGIRKLARQSGEINDWYADIVYEGDEFQYQKGDDPRLHHVPVPPSKRGQMVGAYSIAVLANGYRTAPEFMWAEEIAGIKGKSKAQKGPWADPVFFPEMVKKTVAKRHAKSLPSSTDLDQVLSRDNELYDLEAPRRAPALEEPPTPPPVDQIEPPAPAPTTDTTAGDPNAGKPEAVAEQIEDAEVVEEPPAPDDGINHDLDIPEGLRRTKTDDAAADEGEPEERRPVLDGDKVLADLDMQMSAATDMATLGEVMDTMQPQIDDAMPPIKDAAKDMFEAHQKRIMEDAE